MTGPAKPRPRGGPIARQIWDWICFVCDPDGPAVPVGFEPAYLWLAGFLSCYMDGEPGGNYSPLLFGATHDRWAVHHMLIEALKQAKSEGV